MSLVPEFELGLWNAWIFILPTIILSVVGSRVFGKRGAGAFSGRTRKERMLDSVGTVIIFAFWVYSVFLPLKLGTLWFLAGFVIYSLGSVIEVSAMLGFATTPVDKPVTKGVYRVSRNPMYLGMFCMAVVSEERECLQKYGDAYREYMNEIPRWLGMPKSEKRD